MHLSTHPLAVYAHVPNSTSGVQLYRLRCSLHDSLNIETHPFVSPLQTMPLDLTVTRGMLKTLLSLLEDVEVLAVEVLLTEVSALRMFVAVGHYAIGHQFVQWTSEVP